MTVGEVSQRSGLPVSTIHFYESKGLIQSERTSGNQRRYSPAILRYLAIVKVAQRAGLSLDEVLDALGQYQPGVHLTAAHWRRVASSVLSRRYVSKVDAFFQGWNLRWRST
jgi:MerR family redox-sensitive transcriptional activator SoxR